MGEKVYTVTVGEIKKDYPKGTSYQVIAEDFQHLYEYQIVLALVDYKLRELHKTLQKDCEIQFKSLKDRSGHNAYRRSASFLLMKAIYDIIGDDVRRIKIEFSVSKGYYCQPYKGFVVDQKFLDKVKMRMDELVEENISIYKESYALEEALEIFHTYGMEDKEKLFHYRRSSRVNIYSIGNMMDYYYGFMVQSTGYIKYYELYLFEDGFVLQLPERKNPTVVPEFKPQRKLFDTMRESSKWEEMLGLDTVGDMNDKICTGNISELILVQEALQESKIADIAADIVKQGGKKFVMIAGPSSSGKTTLSHRLSIQLMAHGLNPHPIAVDDYFVDREKTPRDENGDYNFECLESIDVESFNKDMNALLEGKTVEIPSFNFKTGKREYKGNYKTLKQDDILIIEGIHGLNDKMSYTLPRESKFKIYISALTSLNVDEHNRIPTTDGRLIRRMVRDHRTRGASAQRTLGMWPSVRRGEEENIFPFQEEADAMFNSALIYELSVLKQFVEPLLFGIRKEEPEYLEAKRLLKFLDYFLGVSSENIPSNSIIREFVGGSCFKV